MPLQTNRARFGAAAKAASLPQRRPIITPALSQHIEDLALMVDGTPQIHPLAGDPHQHLVEMPAIARPWTAPA